MRERLYERKEKTHIPRRDEGPLGLQRRDEQDGLQEEEKRRKEQTYLILALSAPKITLKMESNCLFVF